MTRRLLPIIAAGLPAAALAVPALAVDFEAGLITDLNPNDPPGLAFDSADPFGGGAIAFDHETPEMEPIQFNGNDIGVYTLFGPSASDGAGFSVPTSNGENGDGIPSNFEAADAAFGAIGNASGRLENGNVIRFSAWVRADPDNPVTVQPQIEPVFKLEFWEFALSGNADFEPGPPPSNPKSGDRIFDTDQNGGVASWLDIDANGSIGTGGTLAQTLASDEWRLIEHTYEVDDTSWGFAPVDQPFVPKTVSDVEEIRAVMFLGDFAGTDMTDGGSMFVDNILVEIFANQAAVTANTNPDPTLSEVSDILGDYNDNGLVEQGDLNQVLNNWGVAFDQVAATWILQRPTEGIVDQAELNVVLNRWGSDSAPDFSGSAVPEPASLALLGAGALVLRRRR